MSELLFIWKSLFRNKLRAGLMIVSIVIAFAMFGTLGAFEQMFYARSDIVGGNRLVVTNKINLTQPLPIAYIDRVRRVEGVEKVTHASWFGGFFREPANAIVAMAVDPDSYLDVYSDELAVDSTSRNEFSAQRMGLLVGETAARHWGWQIGAQIPLSSTIFLQRNGTSTWQFVVVGIFKALKPQFDTNFVLLRYDYFNETRSFARDRISWIVAVTRSSNDDDRIAGEIDQMFANSSDETSTDAEQVFNATFLAQLGNVALVVISVLGAAFFTILMIVTNTALMAIRERSREIGLLKVLGFTGTRLARLVMGEALLLASIGGACGLGLAEIVCIVLQSNGMPGLLLTLPVLLAGIVSIAGFGFLTGLVPSLQATRMSTASSQSQL